MTSKVCLSCSVEKGFSEFYKASSKKVSGMHVPWNLQAITAKQNRVKGNSFNENKEYK